MRPTVTAAEIARLAGVGRAAVSNWRKRHADFPAQVAGTPASPEFDLDEVKAWLRRQGKLADQSGLDSLWWHLSTLGEDPLSALGAAGELILAEARGRRPSPSVRGALPRDVTRDLMSAVRELGPATVFDELLVRHAQSPSTRTRATPAELADFMVTLAEVPGRSVLDPACGIGTLLRSAAGAGATATYGQDIDDALARVARLWLELHDRPGEVRVGDSLRNDAYAGKYFDAVVCSPPFGVANWGQEELGYDQRFEFGVPPRTEPELAWVQHAVAHLRPAGRAVLLMPPAAAGRRAGRRIRAELLRRGALRAVIALPARAAAPHGVPLHLWVLCKPDSPTPPGDVLLVDVSTATGGELARAFADVLAALRGDDREGIARAVPVIELLDDEVDLNPVRRSWPPAGGTDPGSRLTDVQAQLAALVARLPGLIPDFKPSSGTATIPTSSVAELARSGALTILGPTRGRGPDKPAGGRVLTARDVVEDREPSGGPDAPAAPEILVRAGDVVVPVVAHRLTARVVATDGAMLGRNLYVLRPDPEVLEPWFLAGQLRTSMNERQASSLSGVLRFDVRRAQVARLPLSEQRRYAEAYRRLDDFDRAIRRAGALGEELVQLASDGLARGVLSPESHAEQPRKARGKRPS